MKSRLSAGLGIALGLISGAVVAQTASVIDGDTVNVGGRKYHLWGIDAPEPEQQCGSWPAGREGTEHLRQLILGKTVTCEPKAVDRFGRALARCLADKVDLGETMVRDGYAWAFVDYTTDYVDEEKSAYESNRAVHRYGCERPWEWREKRR